MHVHKQATVTHCAHAVSDIPKWPDVTRFTPTDQTNGAALVVLRHSLARWCVLMLTTCMTHFCLTSVLFPSPFLNDEGTFGREVSEKGFKGQLLLCYANQNHRSALISPSLCSRFLSCVQPTTQALPIEDSIALQTHSTALRCLWLHRLPDNMAKRITKKKKKDTSAESQSGLQFTSLVITDEAAISIPSILVRPYLFTFYCALLYTWCIKHTLKAEYICKWRGLDETECNFLNPTGI